MPETKTVETCPFCRLLESNTASPDTTLVSRPTPEVAYFTPLNPITPGHLLFIPTAHTTHASADAAVQLAETMYVGAAYAYKNKINFNLITSCGAAATQTIPHIHLHYVPRYSGDGLVLPWTNQHKTIL